MNLKFSKGFIIGIAGICMLILSSADLQGQTPHFDQLRERIEGGEIFQAGFTHEYQDSYTGEESRTDGEIWIGSDQYRVESNGQVMVVDQEISRVYDSLRNRLLISAYDEEEDDFAPSRMLQGVDDTYRIQEEDLNDEIQIILTSDDPFAIFTQVMIILSPDGRPVEIEAVDQVDNLLITEFEGGQFIAADPAVFEMEIPGDAERIDLRH